MKLFYLTKIRKNHPKSTKILLLSDIHFSNLVKNQTLDAILNFAKKREPNYILLPGDLVDDLDEAVQKDQKARLLTWLEKLASVAPLFFTPGNHDFYHKNPLKGQKSWLIDEKPALFQEIARIPNLTVLNNDSYEDKNLYLFGFTPNPDYYENDQKPGFKEHKSLLLRDLKALNSNFYQNLPKNKLKIALVHSPVFLKSPEIAEFFQEFDLTVSGHMHNGATPPLINELWRSNRGLVAPGKKLAPKNARYQNSNDKNIVLGAVTTLHKHVKPFTHLNAFYPVHLAELKTDPDHKDDLSFKYISF